MAVEDVARDIAAAVHRFGTPPGVQIVRSSRTDEAVPVLVVSNELGPIVAVPVLLSWSPRSVAGVVQECRDLAPSIMPLRFDGALTLLGPSTGSDTVGCVRCAEQWRWETAGGKPLNDPAARQIRGLGPGAYNDAVAAMLMAAARDPLRSAGTLWVLKGDDLTGSQHAVRPIGGCPDCSPLPADTAAAARIDLCPAPVPDPLSYRQANQATEGMLLREAVVDWRLGPVVGVSRSERAPLSLTTAQLSSTERGGATEAGYGRAGNYADAHRIAVFEAIERYCSWRPRGRRPAHWGSYAGFGPDHALDPASLGTHDPRYADDPRFELAPFTPAAEASWLYGWSFMRDAPILVPEQVAYWGPSRPGPEGQPGRRFVYETSNGCGLGNSIEEAILYGLFEVCERDAFLMAWYARTPLTRIALPEGAVVRHTADQLDLLGYELLLFDATNDLLVPAVTALAVHRDRSSGAPQVFVAAGAHLDPRRAIEGAVVELAVNVVNAPSRAAADPARSDPAVLRQMLTEPERVLGLEDHVWLYSLPEARDRFDFLIAGSQQALDWSDVWPGTPEPVPDLTVALRALIGRLATVGLDVVVVDQSEPWIQRRLGLSSVKVIVPGTLAMTFRHVYHRTRGLPRLLDVPHRLGRVSAPLQYEQLDLYPHPFP